MVAGRSIWPLTIKCSSWVAAPRLVSQTVTITPIKITRAKAAVSLNQS